MFTYRKNIVLLNDSFKPEQFPERFLNEIYVSDLNEHFYYKYTSPLSIKYTYEGTDNYNFNKHDHVVKDNELLIINHETEVESFVESSLKKQAGSKGMSVFLDPICFKELLDARNIYPADIPLQESAEDCSVPVFCEEVIRNEKINDVFSKMYYSFLRNDKAGVDEECYYTIAELILDYDKTFTSKLDSISKVKYSTKKELCKRVNIARKFIEDNADETFDLDKVASVACISRYLLIRTFRQLYGFTPNQYYQQVKIKAAKSLLKKHSVVEVAYLLGYENVFYFSNQFKKITGYSPKQFIAQK